MSYLGRRSKEDRLMDEWRVSFQERPEGQRQLTVERTRGHLLAQDDYMDIDGKLYPYIKLKFMGRCGSLGPGERQIVLGFQEEYFLSTDVDLMLKAVMVRWYSGMNDKPSGLGCDKEELKARLGI